MGANNVVMLTGRLGRDPELRYTQDNKPVCSFSLATDIGKGKKPDWHNVVCWDKQAETCAQYLKKGSLVIVQGALKNRQWEKDGVKHYRTEVVAGNVNFLGGTQKSEETEQSDQPFTDDDAPF